MVVKLKDNIIDLNSILLIFNNINLIISIYLSIFFDSSKYVDNTTFLLNIALCIEIYVFLKIEIKSRNPFVLIVAYLMIFYYSFRVITIYFFPYSSTIERVSNSISPENVNYVLIYIFIANIFLILGLLSNKIIVYKNNTYRYFNNNIVAFFFVIIILLTYFINISEIPFSAIFINKTMFMFMSVVYIIYNRENSNKIIILLILVEMLIHGFFGSRASILGLVQAILIAEFSIKGFSAIRVKNYKLILYLSPLILLSLVFLFEIGTNARMKGGFSISYLNFTDQIDLIDGINIFSNFPIDSISNSLSRIFDRVGYLDITTDLIANINSYNKVVNLDSYHRSFIDNFFTPGFDIYDQPRISYSLQNVYGNLPETITKSNVETYYQSDQLGIYSELFIIFGEIYSFPIYYIIGALTIKIYSKLIKNISIYGVFNRTIFFIAFMSFMNSYGFDWVIIEYTLCITSIYIYRKIFTFNNNLH